MNAKGGPGGDKLGIGEIYWFRYDLAEDDRLIEVLSDKGELFFYRLRKHYVYRAGALPYDPSAICTKMGYKTVRPFNACFEELVAAGLVSVEDGMVRFPHGDRLIAEVQMNRDRKANDGRSGGEAKAANAKNVRETSANVSPNFDEVCSKHDNDIEQNQSLSSSYQKTSNHESVNKTTSVGSKNGTHALKSVGGGGGSDIQRIITEFDRLLGSCFGDVAKRERVARCDPGFAGKWLELVGGSVEAVKGALGTVVERESLKRDGKIPGSLAYFQDSILPELRAYGTAATYTAADLRGPGRSNVAAIPTTSPGDDTWLRVYTTAQNNGDKDIVRAIDAFIDGKDIAGANNFARSVEAIVNGKKERAAA